MREVGRTLATAPRSRARYKSWGTTAPFPKRHLPSRRQRCGWTPVRPRRDTSPALENPAAPHARRGTRQGAPDAMPRSSVTEVPPRTRDTATNRKRDSLPPEGSATERPVTPSRRDSHRSACRDSSSPWGHGLSRHVPLFLFLPFPTGPPILAHRGVDPCDARTTYVSVRLAALLGSPCAASKIGGRTQTARNTQKGPRGLLFFQHLFHHVPGAFGGALPRECFQPFRAFGNERRA